MRYRGRFKNGVIVLDEEVDLPEGAIVQIDTITDEAEGQTLRERLMNYAGRGSGLPSDLARNHDHYLYGLARK